jgi:DNA gyrase subunit A
MLALASGQAIRFEETDVRSMGLQAAGVMGVKLANDTDGIVAMDIVSDDSSALYLTVTDNGLAKATPLTAYPQQGRNGQGVVNVRLPKDATEVVAAVAVTADDHLYISTAGGVVKRIKVDKIRVGNRPIKPRPILTLGKRNRVTGLVPLLQRKV